MKRIVLRTLAASALAIAAPTTALASRHHHHRGASARSHHRHHHAKPARVLRFGARSASTSTGTSSPSAPGDETAGTITSFEGGVLKITLGDGTVVTGKVTESTEIECAAGSSQDGAGDDGGAGDDDQSSTTARAADTQDSQGDDGGDDQGENQDEATSCGLSALVVGATVREAELRISSGGAVWEKIELS